MSEFFIKGATLPFGNIAGHRYRCSSQLLENAPMPHVKRGIGDKQGSQRQGVGALPRVEGPVLMHAVTVSSGRHQNVIDRFEGYGSRLPARTENA